MEFIDVKSREMPPCVASTWPSKEEPAPKGMTGVFVAEQISRTFETSSVLFMNATASGGDIA
jgi:hypothetical protein